MHSGWNSFVRVRFISTAAFIVCLWSGIANGQDVKIRSSAADSLSSRVQAQAALLEAQAEREKHFAEARKSHAEASSAIAKAISDGADLEMKVFRNYWQKRREVSSEKWDRLERRIEGARKYTVTENARNVAVWERTIEGPLEKMRPGIRSGSHLTRIAQQIDAATGLSSSTSVSASISADLAVLDERTLGALKLSVASINGPVDVSLLRPLPAIMSRWPHLFLDEELRIHAYEVNRVAQHMFDPKLSRLQKFELEKEVLHVLEDATNAFYRKYPLNTRGSLSIIESRRVHAADEFLAELGRTLANVAESDNSSEYARPCYVDQYAPEERNAATLIQYMATYGLTFRPAQASTEYIYDRLFLQFRDLARQLDAAPSRDSITEPIINLDFDAMMAEKGDDRAHERTNN